MDSILLGIYIGGTNLKVGRVENSTIVAQTFSGVNINSTGLSITAIPAVLPCWIKAVAT